MALGHGPTVVTNGLVLALDAADINSFDKNENLRTNSDTGGFFPVVGTWTSTATSTDISAPNGSSTTYKVVSAGGGQASIDIAYQQITLTAGVTYTVSAHFYATGSTTSSRTIGIAIFGNGLSGTGPIVLPQNEWVRRSFTFTATTTSNTGQIRIIDNDTSGFNTTNGAVIYLWGAQLETGSTVSSYYPTAGTAKNRGSTWIDLMGNGNTGTLTNGPTFSSANGGSVVFDGTNDYVNIGVGRGVNQFSADFAVSAWVMRLPGGPTYGNVIGDYYTGSVATTNEWQIMMSSTAEFNLYRVGSNYVIPNTASGYSTSQWINVVVSRIGSTVSMYANNNLIATATNSTVFGTATGNLNIGIDGNNSSEPLSGRISNVMIYKNKGLTAAEIQQNFNALRGRFGV